MKLHGIVASAALFCTFVQAAEIESPQELAARLTPQQKQEFDAAVQAFDAQHYPDALAGFSALLHELPSDPVLAKFAAESALNSDNAKVALYTVKPVGAQNPDDWQATALLARAYSAVGDNNGNEAMAHLRALHDKGATPPSMQAYILERIKLGDNILLIRPSLVPWGPYKVYYLGQLMNAQGQIFLRITLESSDFDQAAFAQKHRKQAAAGVRLFSLDGYQQTGPNTQKRT